VQTQGESPAREETETVLELKPFVFYKNRHEHWILPVAIDPDFCRWIHWDPSKKFVPDPTGLSTPAPGDIHTGTSFDLLQALLDGEYEATNLLQPKADLPSPLASTSQSKHVPWPKDDRHHKGYYVNHSPWVKNDTKTVVRHHV
jgi:hypothetical protein